MYVLGIWDGHDAGAALIKDSNIIAAVNEERYTKRKLDVGFPANSIRACLNIAKIKPEEVKVIAAATSDLAKTLTRIFPSVKEYYYQFRRRKAKPNFQHPKRAFKYKLTQFGPNFITTGLSESLIKINLKNLGFSNYKFVIYDQHMCHAAGVFMSNMKKALVITLDGVGDGKSGSVNIFENNKLKRISSISSRDSLGIFFEQVTNLLGMRELEDEGKVMALSNYAYPVQDKDNKMLSLFEVKGLNIKARYSVTRQYSFLKNLLWNTQREQFAYMAQKTLEIKMLELFANAIKQTKIRDVCWSGGVASNIKANMLVRKIAHDWYVFPAMGDGGLALGAALLANNEFYKISSYKNEDIYFGDGFSNREIEEVLKKSKGIKYAKERDIAKKVAGLVLSGKIVLWFQGRTEFGPRALGNRSILASAESYGIKDTLNMMVKNRDWFQPFCPSLLEEDARLIFCDYDNRPARFMTMGYMVKKDRMKQMANVINVDNSARPQMVGNENMLFRRLLLEVKKRNKLGVVLNTSFNIHGMPICNTPQDAIIVLKATRCRYLAIGNFMVEQKS